MARQVKTTKTETVSIKTLASVADNIHHLAELHEDRHEMYGEDYLRSGASMIGIFPEGLALRCAADFTRFALLNQIHGKLMRYAARFNDGGHGDSLDDISVYAQLLRHTDEAIK